MSDLLHNMSAPPRSEVKFEQKQLHSYILFSPITLSKLLSNNRIILRGLEKRVKKYYEHHKEIENIIERPTGYMIGEAIELDIRNLKNNNGKLLPYAYEECHDLHLLIVVFCSTVGDLYIPNRSLSFEKNKFNKLLLFPKEEVNS